MQNINPSNPAGGNEHTADSILAAFEDALAVAHDTRALLDVWTRRFPAMAPDFALAVTDYAAGSMAVSSPPGSDRFAGLAVETVVSYAIPGQTRDTPTPSSTPARTLQECARNAGLSFPAQLAAQLRVPPALLERLNRREIESATVPRPFVSDLAAALGISLADCGHILRGMRGRSLAVQEPRLPYGRGVSFNEAMESEGSEDERAYWTARAAYGADLESEGLPP